MGYSGRLSIRPQSDACIICHGLRQKILAGRRGGLPSNNHPSPFKKCGFSGCFIAFRTTMLLASQERGIQM